MSTNLGPPISTKPGAGEEAAKIANAMTSMQIGELISKMAIGVAEGQFALDQTCMEIAKFMGEAKIQFGTKPGTGEPEILSLIELGFTPNFYQFVDTILEVRLAISSQYEESSSYGTKERDRELSESQNADTSNSTNTGVNYNYGLASLLYGYNYGTSSVNLTGSSSSLDKTVHVTTVDANYASKYSYSVEGSSLMKTKIVPLTPPAILEELIRANADARRQRDERMRLIEQSTAFLGEIESMAATVLGTLVGNDPTLDPENIDHASLIKDEINFLFETFTQLTFDHWAIIANNYGRRGCDTSIAAALTKAESIFTDTSSKHSPDGVTSTKAAITETDVDVVELFKNIKEDNLPDFQKWIKDVSNRFQNREEFLKKQLEPPAVEPAAGQRLDGIADQ